MQLGHENITAPPKGGPGGCTASGNILVSGGMRMFRAYDLTKACKRTPAGNGRWRGQGCDGDSGRRVRLNGHGHEGRGFGEEVWLGGTPQFPK